MSVPMVGAWNFSGFLADGGNSPSDVDQTTGKGPEWGEAAPVGLLVIVLLCIAVYFLVKSLNRQLKKVPESFATVGAPAAAGAGAPTEASGGDAGSAAADSKPEGAPAPPPTES